MLNNEVGDTLMNSEHALTPEQLDLLRELGNIGAGNATTALSAMLGDRKLEMVVPSVVVLSLPETMELLGGPEAPVAGIYISVSGDISGHMALLLPQTSALELVHQLMGVSGGQLDEMGRSVLQEVGNIVVGSYLNALSDMTGFKLMPSVPALAIDMAGAIWGAILAGAQITEDLITVIKTDFISEGRQVEGHILLLPGKDEFRKFFQILLGNG